MGTDIHMQAEMWVFDDEDRTQGHWVHVPDPIRQCRMCKGTGVKHEWSSDSNEYVPVLDGERCHWCDVTEQLTYYQDDTSYDRRNRASLERIREAKGDGGGWEVREWYDGRNYDTFAILANVRNGVGFAGVDTGDEWPIIAYPRGVPDDCSPEVAEYMDSYDHTPSWLTLEEIVRFPWKTTLRKSRGLVHPAEYLKYRRTGKPDSWSGSVGGGSLRVVTNEEMEVLLAEHPEWGNDQGTFFHPSGVFTRIEWSTTAFERCGPFLDSMQELASLVGEAPARIVFYFDS